MTLLCLDFLGMPLQYDCHINQMDKNKTGHFFPAEGVVRCVLPKPPGTPGYVYGLFQLLLCVLSYFYLFSALGNLALHSSNIGACLVTTDCIVAMR